MNLEWVEKMETAEPGEELPSEKIHRQNIESRIQNFGRTVGTRYSREKIENYTGENAENVMRIIGKIPEIYSDGLSFLFIGGRGTGKTLGAYFIGLEAIRQGYSVFYRTAKELRDSILKNGNDGDNAKNTGLLILDEVGKTMGGKNSEWELTEIISILDFRYRNLKPTIMITNLSPEKLPGYIGEDIIDRMKSDEWERVIFVGDSKRGKK